ncbi:hypothetical protein SAMN04489806_0701 [Paramicrobacterium humi]|uniref:Tetratricopeptide repeat-containing protein n=2 Tax=Paramicrobacterium humi TaxID=640635 RepID=A0A1H4JGV8_9MICO|nr:hypothetical protein SAMN04489806_0701 [Microbacterium humi]
MGFLSDNAAENIEEARICEAWATDRENFELDEDVTAQFLLTLASEKYQKAGELDEAWRVAQAAVAAGDGPPLGAHSQLLDLAFERDDRASALHYLDEVRRARTDDLHGLQSIAETLELRDEVDLAQRWFIIGMRAASWVGSDAYYEVFLLGRYRVRRLHAIPLDGLDVDAEHLRIDRGLAPLADGESPPLSF